MTDLEKRVKNIEVRNQRVENDKLWETSRTRKFSITGLTYIIAVGYLFLIDNQSPWLNSLVPAGGYFLSTLVLKNIRNKWDSK